MKKWLIAALVLLLAAFAGLYYVMNKPHRSVNDEEAITVSADSLFLAFQQNEAGANERYLNQVLLIHGKVNSVETNTDGHLVVVLETGDPMFGVNCTFDKEYPVKPGDEITLKGICTGYLADVVINQAILSNNP